MRWLVHSMLRADSIVVGDSYADMHGSYFSTLAPGVLLDEMRIKSEVPPQMAQWWRDGRRLCDERARAVSAV